MKPEVYTFADLSPNSRPIDASCNYTAYGEGVNVFTGEEVNYQIDGSSIEVNNSIGANLGMAVCLAQDALLWRSCIHIRFDDGFGGALGPQDFSLAIFRNLVQVASCDFQATGNNVRQKFCCFHNGALWRACQDLTVQLQVFNFFDPFPIVRSRISIDFKMP